MRAWTIITLLVVIAYQTGWCQSDTTASDSLGVYFQFEDASPLSCLLTYFPPFFIQHGIELKSFIRSKKFLEIRKQYGDRKSVDAIYVRAMQMTDNNTAIALLLATIATFDHRVVGLKIPLLSVCFPLSNESDEEFERRVRHLPLQLYEDTPTEGDRDKLQHFFGSAFFTVIFEASPPAARIGNFVEVGEEEFIEGGVLDDRDLRADREGQRFGLALLDDNRQMPSKFLRLTQKKISFMDNHCCGVW